MAKASRSGPLRRSVRVNIGCPVRISGVSADQRPFSEDTQVVTISKYGAKMKTRMTLQVGMNLKVQPLRGDRKVVIFKVVWVGREGTPREGEVGLEYAGKASDMLGVCFPKWGGPAK
jgi:hypothetical protein